MLDRNEFQIAEHLRSSFITSPKRLGVPYASLDEFEYEDLEEAYSNGWRDAIREFSGFLFKDRIDFDLNQFMQLSSDGS